MHKFLDWTAFSGLAICVVLLWYDTKSHAAGLPTLIIHHLKLLLLPLHSSLHTDLLSKICVLSVLCWCLYLPFSIGFLATLSCLFTPRSAQSLQLPVGICACMCVRGACALTTVFSFPHTYAHTHAHTPLDFDMQGLGQRSALARFHMAFAPRSSSFVLSFGMVLSIPSWNGLLAIKAFLFFPSPL